MFWYKITILKKDDPDNYLKSRLHDKFFEFYFMFKMPSEMGFFGITSEGDFRIKTDKTNSIDQYVYYICVPDELHDIIPASFKKYSPDPCKKPKRDDVQFIGNGEFMQLLE